jgi:hypothetical protein
MTERDFRPWTSRVRSPSPILNFSGTYGLTLSFNLTEFVR